MSDGFVHSCLAKAASLAADVVALIRALITAAPVAGFDETTLRSGSAGDRKCGGGVLQVGQAGQRPGPERGALADVLGLVQPDRGLGQGVIVGVADRADRGNHAREHQRLGEVHRGVLRIRRQS